MTVAHPPWWPAWLQLVRDTVRDPAFRAWAIAQRLRSPQALERALSPPSRGGELAYRYDGRLSSFREARRRGWAACAEVAAYAAAAAAVLWPDATVRAIGEGALSSDVAYSHLRVDVNGVVVDPYDREARLGQASVVDWVADAVAPGGTVSGGPIIVLARPVPLESWR